MPSRIRRITAVFVLFFVLAGATAQDNSKKAEQNPPVKVNVLNVCTPSADDQQAMKAALSGLPETPSFAHDYEISRGLATTEEGKDTKYVRLRRDFQSDSPLVTVQYSLSLDTVNTIETLVFRGRDVKELLALSIEDKLSTSVSKPSTVIQADTPVSRIRVERVGKTTLALSRCDDVDQSGYEPLFAQASTVLAEYHRLLKLRTLLTSDLTWLSSSPTAAGSRKDAKSSKSSAAPASGTGEPR